MKKQEVAKKMKSPEPKKAEEYYYGKCKVCGKKHTRDEDGQHPMSEGHSKKSQKGKMSKESVGKNEGEKHYLGKNEEPVA